MSRNSQKATGTKGSLGSVYQVLRRPRITEKSAVVGSLTNSVVFEVHPAASKPLIKQAVEEIFKVKVKHVRVSNYKGKLKRSRATSGTGQRKDWKKAYVSLQEGNTLDFIEGL